jgi:hypothetical protein
MPRAARRRLLALGTTIRLTRLQGAGRRPTAKVRDSLALISVPNGIRRQDTPQTIVATWQPNAQSHRIAARAIRREAAGVTLDGDSPGTTEGRRGRRAESPGKSPRGLPLARDLAESNGPGGSS